MNDTVPIIGINRHRLRTDGEGVTTLVAFYGCPLQCKYCLNPQSSATVESGKYYDCELLYKELKQDELYFLATGGGITFGGGEPCLRSDFIIRFRELCGPEWRITVETSLNVPQEHIKLLLPVVNHYIIDIKDMNNNIYERYTGKSNQRMTENLHWLIVQGKANQITIRVPQIPSYNTASDVESSMHQLKEMGLTRLDPFIYRT